LGDLSIPLERGSKQDQAYLTRLVYRAELDHLLNLRQRCPALCAGGTRQALTTCDDGRFYAFLRGDVGGDRALAIFNFQPDAQTVSVDLDGQSITTLEDLRTGEILTVADQILSLDMPAYGYFIYRITV
jgi:hypothetical protein